MKIINKIKLKNFKLNDWFMNSLSLPSHYTDLPLLAYFNFLRANIKKLKGDMIEFGVFRGDSIISTALLLKRMGIKKKLYGFDTFNGFKRKKHKFDNLDIFNKLYKNKNISKKHLEWIKLRNEAIKENLIDTHEWKNTSYEFVKKRIKKFGLQNDIILVKGDIAQTVQNLDFSKNKIASVFMDCNLYEPHLYALNYSWKYLVKNGGIFLDDYFSLKYPGARIAINQFCKKHRIKIKFVKNIPGDFKRYYIKK